MHKERRRFKRYAVGTEDIQAIIHPGPDAYPVKDIGRGGLAIEYTPFPGKTIHSQTIDIVSRHYDSSLLKGISCRTIYDIETLMEGQSFSGSARRIRGLRFLELTTAQEEKLDRLIVQFSKGHRAAE